MMLSQVRSTAASMRSAAMYVETIGTGSPPVERAPHTTGARIGITVPVTAVRTFRLRDSPPQRFSRRLYRIG
jgi:hypothetical protein